MKKLLSLLCLLSLVLSGHAQCPAREGLLTDGEEIRYELFFNWKFIWIKAGEATLTTHLTSYQGAPAYESTLLASTNQRADLIFRLRDTIRTVVTPEIVPLYFVKRCDEGKEMIYDRAWFDYGDGVCTARQTKIYDDGRVRETSFDDSRCIYDMVSLLLYSRSFDTDSLTIGQQLQFPMVTGVRVEEQNLIYLGKKDVETLSGSIYRCQVFSLVQKKKNKDGELEDREIIRFYTTDDEQHLPVQLDLILKFGVAKAKLASVRTEN